jgi:hypothetical protein
MSLDEYTSCYFGSNTHVVSFEKTYLKIREIMSSSQYLLRGT